LGRVVRIADAVLVPAEGSRAEGRGLCRCRRLYDYQGPTSWALTGEVNVPGCIVQRLPTTVLWNLHGMVYDNGNVVRTSVGVGLIWASPFGPLRFDYAVPLTKGQFDRVQQFKFGGGTSF
jgi:outer membrane protein insertion porin family